MLAAADGAEVVLTAFGPAPLARLAAEALGVRITGTYLAPAVPTAEFALPGLPEGGGLGRAGNFEAGRALLARDRSARSRPRIVRR